MNWLSNMELVPWALNLRRFLKSQLRNGLIAISSVIPLIDGFVSYIWSIEIPEDIFFLLLLVIPAVAAYLLDRFDRELSDDELASQQKPATVAFTSPTLKSEEVWEKYDKLQQNKVHPLICHTSTIVVLKCGNLW